MNSTTLEILLKIQDEASSALEGFGSKLQSWGSQLSSVGTQLTTDVSLPIAGIGTASALLATNFQEAVDKIQTGAGASAEEVQNLSQQLLAMASNGAQQTPVDLANGMYYVESAGFRAQDAVNVLKAAMDGANVSGVDLNTVAQQLVTVMNATHTPTADAQNVMALLNSTVGQGVMTMQDLIGAMSTGIIPKAEAVGLGIKDVSAALDTMTREGVPAQDAATRLGMTLSLMASPTAQASKALEGIGLSSTALADTMRSQGLIPALQELEDHLTQSGLTAVQQNDVIAKAFGGGRTSGAIELLLQNIGQMQSAFDGLNGGAANFGADVALQSESAQAAFNRMKASAAAAGTEIGNALIPLEAEIFPKIAHAIEAMATWFDKLPDWGKNALILSAAFVAMVGPLMSVTGSIMKLGGSIISLFGEGGALSFVTGFITDTVIPALIGFVATIGLWPILIGVAVVAVVALIVTHWTEVKNFLTTAGTDILDVLTKAWNAIKTVVTAVWDAIVALIKFDIDLVVGTIVLALDAFDPQWRTHWQAIASFFTDLWNTIKAFLQETWNWITALFNTSLSGIETLWDTVWGGVHDFFIGIWGDVKSSLSNALSFVRGEITDFVSWAEGVFKPVQNAVNAIGGAASGFMNAAKGAVGAVASVGSQITHFATGGIVNGPTIALVGEAGPEAIIPLSAFNGGMSLARGGSGGGATIIVNINGGNYLDSQGATMIANELARQVVRQVRVSNYAR